MMEVQIDLMILLNANHMALLARKYDVNMAWKCVEISYKNNKVMSVKPKSNKYLEDQCVCLYILIT